MIHAERVRQMIKLATYDEQNKERDKRPMRYYRKDYLTLEMVKSFFCGSIAYALILFAIAACLLEQGQDELGSADIVNLLVLVVVAYLVFMAAYFAITYHVYRERYEKGRKEARKYYVALKKVNACYQQEASAIPEEQPGGGPWKD